MRIVFFSILLSLLYSCNQVSLTKTVVKGQVIDVISDSSVEGVEIFISGITASTGNNVHEVATLVTDENGRFEHSFSAHINKFYYCGIDQNTPNLAQGIGSIGNFREDITSGSVNDLEFRIAFGGYVREDYININCDSSISLQVERRHQIEDATRNLKFTLSACQSLQGRNFHSAPSGLHTYIWRTMKDENILTENQDSFNLAIGERKEFRIEW
ncbi:MAG: hypothetical protein AAFO82_15510 [Bacteroidota bacterium]